MLSTLFLSVADAVISYTIEQLDPVKSLKTWLKRDLATMAFQKALARAYAAFARQHPEYAASLFDQSFLSKAAVPEISKLLIRTQHPDPALLAQAWGESIGFDTHSDFCKRATKPASDFLLWLEAELKTEQAFQALFDSRALDSLPRLEAEIEKLTKELTRGLETALKIASEYEKIMFKIEGDIKDSNVILGDGNQISVSNIYNTYYTGSFDKLNDFYVPPDGVFQRVRVDEFVGRDWLTAKVDAFLNDPSRKSGAFLLIGDAGVGKTSFMADLVKERRYLHLFAEQVAGDANLQRALQSLGSQLVTHYQIDPYKDRDTLTQLAVFPDFLERLLRLAASTLTNGEKIVIVCDALDEAGTFPEGNVFGLPNVLPDGVYFILSQRPVNTKLPNFEALNVKLEAQGADNLLDMQTYLSAVAQRSEVAMQIRSKEYSEAFFIQTLKEKSLGVWMYLHYIIKEIENGSRAPLDLENLPTGLIGYYADYWDDWRYGRRGRGKGEETWNNLYVPLLTTLAASQESITVEQLIEWTNVSATPREVTPY
ncbi:MAG: ATP-binding protein [Anaerolineales bacterium]|uniref:ATP-binding protein n=1 Tax=Candidatus Villigracilis proximus TaxID=3140683 RepID=UPI003135C579|nr:ATP-binding protein [Anaerolineales bacterium]